MRKRQLWLCLAMLIIMVNACTSANSHIPTEPATDQPSVSIVHTATSTTTLSLPTLQPTKPPTATAPKDELPATPSPTPKPTIQAIDTQACVYASKFIEDVTIQDGDILPAGQQMEKIWRIRNSGTCRWEEGTSIIHIKAQKFDTTGRMFIPPALPGEEVEVHLTFTTPKAPGVYDSYWRLENLKGELFGGVLYMRFKTSATLVATATTSPSATPQPTNTPISTPTPTATPIPAATPTPTGTVLSGCSEVNPQFKGVLSQASMLRLDVGCAMGTVFQQTGTVQEFWINVGSQDAHQRFRSLLLKINDTGTIYVLAGKDTLTYEASVTVYKEDSTGDSACDAPAPPDGYITPQHSFAEVWCVHHYWDVIGWPRQNEVAADLVLQMTARGILIRVNALPTAVYYLALDLNTAHGTVQMGP